MPFGALLHMLSCVDLPLLAHKTKHFAIVFNRAYSIRLPLLFTVKTIAIVLLQCHKSESFLFVLLSWIYAIANHFHKYPISILNTCRIGVPRSLAHPWSTVHSIASTHIEHPCSCNSAPYYCVGIHRQHITSVTAAELPM